MMPRPDLYIAKTPEYQAVGETKSVALANLQHVYRQEGIKMPTDMDELQFIPIFTRPIPGLILQTVKENANVQNFRRPR